MTRSPALPTWFEPNVGQFAPDVRFASAAQHYRLSLTHAGIGVSVPVPAEAGAGHVERSLWLRFAGARPVMPIEGRQRLPGVSHYYLGNDRSQWREHVAQFGRVQYSQVWDGIDAVVYGSAAQLEYDFIVAPGHDPRTIALDLDGADSVSIDRDGALVVDVDGAHVVQRAPVAYQEIAGTRRTVDVAYRIEGTRVGFTVGQYDRTRPLVIDPIVIVYASFLGGSGSEFVEANSQTAGIAVDSAGNLIVALDTNSVNLPAATNAAPASSNILIVKVNPTASAVIFSTYLGGSGADTRGNLDVDPNGAIYVSGRTESTNLPVTAGAIRATIGATDPADGLLARFTPAGVLDYLTYIGGAGTDSAEAVAFARGKVYVTGSTSSADLPVTPDAAQKTFAGVFDAWIARLDLSKAIAARVPVVRGRQRAGRGLLDRGG